MLEYGPYCLVVLRIGVLRMGMKGMILVSECRSVEVETLTEISTVG